MSRQIKRRDFLKSLSLISLLPFLNKEPTFTGKINDLSQRQDAPNILILVFDTLSAKHMSLYGYQRETTPHLARFAEKATVYHAHHAGGNFTTPGTASLLTGSYPWSHRAFSLDGTVTEAYRQRNLFKAFAGGIYNRMAYTHNLMAHLLLDQFGEEIDLLVDPREFSLFDSQLLARAFPNDIRIAYLTDDYLHNNLKEYRARGSLFLYMLDRIRIRAQEENFRQEYADLFPKGTQEHTRVNMFFILEHAINGIKELISNSRRPFLGYFHLYPPHEPYRPRREFAELFDDGWLPMVKSPRFFSDEVPDEALTFLRREYDQHLAYADAEFGRLYDFMVETGILDNTYVVFTSDHGELFERGIHGHVTPTMYEPLLHVPLIISKPNQQQREDVYASTSCVDLLPTLLYATGRDIPDWVEGQVLPPFANEENSSERIIYSVEAKRNPKQAPLTRATIAMVAGRYKLIHYFGYDDVEDEYEMYDVIDDPEETKDLYLSKESIRAEVREELMDKQNELKKKLQMVNQPY